MENAQRAGDLSAAAEAIAAGEVLTLAAGDAAYIPGNLIGEIRNAGQERAVGLAFLVGPPEGMAGKATPPPQPLPNTGMTPSAPGGALRALVRLGHIEHPGGFEGDDLRGAVTGAHDRGDGRDPLLALPE